MDDGGYFDFIEIKLVSGALRWEDQIRLCQSLINVLLRCRFNLGEGAETLSLGRELHDGAWHRSVNFNIGSFLRAFLEHLWPFWSFLSASEHSFWELSESIWRDLIAFWVYVLFRKFRVGQFQLLSYFILFSQGGCVSFGSQGHPHSGQSSQVPVACQQTRGLHAGEQHH